MMEVLDVTGSNTGTMMTQVITSSLTFTREAIKFYPELQVNKIVTGVID